MPTLYRSPDVIIGDHRWHVVVHQHKRGDRPIILFRFRPNTERLETWQPLSAWQGHKLKNLFRRLFRRYQLSIQDAIAGAVVRKPVARRAIISARTDTKVQTNGSSPAQAQI